MNMENSRNFFTEEKIKDNVDIILEERKLNPINADKNICHVLTENAFEMFIPLLYADYDKKNEHKYFEMIDMYLDVKEFQTVLSPNIFIVKYLNDNKKDDTVLFFKGIISNVAPTFSNKIIENAAVAIPNKIVDHIKTKIPLKVMIKVQMMR